jgi:hypothetical protein
LLDQLNQAGSELASLVWAARPDFACQYQTQIKKLEEQRPVWNPKSTHRGVLSTVRAGHRRRRSAADSKDGALIEFAVFRPFDPKRPTTKGIWRTPMRYVIRPQADLLADLGAEEIDAQVNFRQALRDPQRTIATSRALIEDHAAACWRPVTQPSC